MNDIEDAGLHASRIMAAKSVAKPSQGSKLYNITMNHNNNPDRLLVAASKNHSDAIRTLISEHQVDASHANAVGQSALHIASLWGHLESVQALIELGANVNAKNTMTGASPLHMVAQSRKGLMNDIEARIRIVESLAAAGAKKDQLDNLGNLPVDSPTLENEEYRALREALQPSAPEIIQVLEDRDADALKELLSNHGDMASMEYMGKTPVMIVVDDILTDIDENPDDLEGGVDCLNVLLSHNARTDGIASTDELKSNESPLYRLVAAVREAMHQEKNEMASLCEAVELMIKYGAILDTETFLLLHQAARRNEVTFAKYCIENLGMNPNRKGRQGMTPLQFAARSGQLEMVVSNVSSECDSLRSQYQHRSSF